MHLDESGGTESRVGRLRAGEPLTLATASVAISVLEIALAISLAALVFPGGLDEELPRAMGAFLIGGAVAAIVVGLKSSFSGMLAGVQDATAVVVAVMVARMAERVDPDQRAATLLVLIAMSTLVTGVALWALGRLRLGGAVRYVPSPVISGFMAGTGWLLLRGGVEVMIDDTIAIGRIDDLLQWSVAQFWLPGLVMALLIVFGSVRRWHPAFVSITLLGTFALFYVIAAVVSSVEVVEADGWLLGPFESPANWEPLLGDLGDADWGLVLGQSGSIGAVALVAIVGLLLNLSAIEATTGEDVEFDRELTSAGAANVLGGLAGGAATYHMLGDTLLARSLGVRSRVAPLLVGAVTLLVLVVGSGIVERTPRLIAGGLLASLGLDLLYRWLEQLRAKILADELIEVAVLLTVGLVGVLEGVAAGVILAAGIFIVRYSQLEPVRRTRTGSSVRSHVDRSATARSVLDTHAESLVVLELEGYLFFGSVTKLSRVLRSLDESARFLILDLSRVSGVDASALEGFGRSLENCRDRGTRTAVCGARSMLRGVVGRDEILFFEDRDRAAEWAEEELLGEFGPVDETRTGTDEMPTGIRDVFEKVILGAGERVFTRGEPGSSMYLVEAGELSVWLEDAEGRPARRLRRVGPGALLGEIAFLTGETRSATVISDTEVTLSLVDREQLSDLRRSDPARGAAFDEMMLGRLARRVITTNEMLDDLAD